MIVYHKTKQEFMDDVLTNDIDRIVESHLRKVAGKSVGNSELEAFRISLGYMDKILQDSDIPPDSGIAIEYHLPQTSKRVDFIISGTDGTSEHVVIVELKQWQECILTDKDGIVRTRFQGTMKETSHPAYQAWSYAAILASFNATIEEECIGLHPCAYLHNYANDNVLKHSFYNYYLQKAPIFIKSEALALRAFIKRYIKKGDTTKILYRIDKGKIRPSKSLADSLRNMIKGNREFILIDDQKIVFENAKNLALHSHEQNKNVLIVHGGPGTGKSVVAINLLVELNRKGKMAQYVTKTSAPREVYFEKLSGEKKKVELKSMFVGSGSFMHAPENILSALIVDEAHRLTKKTGFLRQGENQIKEIIRSACFTVFFIDPDQRVHINDYGESQLIELFGKQLGAKVHHLSLESQFRCNGSDGYLAWLDNVLEIRTTANMVLRDANFNYDFRVIKDPKTLQQLIFEKNATNNKARLVAGYCWDWKSKDKPTAYDIEFPEVDFHMRWNLGDYGGTWVINPGSVTEVGCIHTVQGLEVDYIGVIIGPDLVVRNGRVQVDPTKRSKMDKSISGWRKIVADNPVQGNVLLSTIIKNTYRTLMTRGLKGCYIYCTDKETSEYFSSCLNEDAYNNSVER